MYYFVYEILWWHLFVHFSEMCWPVVFSAISDFNIEGSATSKAVQSAQSAGFLTYVCSYKNVYKWRWYYFLMEGSGQTRDVDAWRGWEYPDLLRARHWTATEPSSLTAAVAAAGEEKIRHTGGRANSKKQSTCPVTISEGYNHAFLLHTYVCMWDKAA